MPYGGGAGGGSGHMAAALFPFADGRPVPQTSPYPLTAAHRDRSMSSHIDADEVMRTSGAAAGPSSSSSSSSIQRPAAKGHKVKSASPAAGGSGDEKEGEGDKATMKKRRRVVVACDVCRRKKVKCRGLPNAANTCTNCETMGYVCTFTVESDRSRGKYEILESQRDTLLTALRSVAPELAGQFDRGELHITSPSGGTGSYNNKTGHSGIAERAAVNAPSLHNQDISSISYLHPTKRHSNPMVPDMEDGRPRYYGGSSSLHSFNEIDSRPPSPTGNARKGITETNSHGISSSSKDIVSGNEDSLRKPGNAQRVNFSVLPTPMPQFPRNSIDWVRELRRKTLVAVGRDEVFATEGWFNKFPLPSSDLLNELLDFFFHRLNPLLPILHEYTLRRDLGMGRADRDSAFRGLIFTVITIASRFFKDDPRVWAVASNPESAGDHWAAASRFHHQVYAASLINVQVSLLSCAFMPSSLGIGTSWTVLGVAVRALFDIGSHVERAYVSYTPFEQERRRRTFWAAFCLDSILSINMGRPLAIRPSDISVNFPLLATEDALTVAERTGGPIEELHPRDTTPCLAAGFIHLIKVCTLVRDTLLTIYQPTTTTTNAIPPQRVTPSYKDMTILCKRLDEWVTEIPPFLQDISSSPFPVQAAFIQCGRNNVRLYILKPFLYNMRASLHGSNGNGHVSSSTGGGGGGGEEDLSILRKMLLPQCTNHARATLMAVQAVHEDVGVPVNYFLVHQSFLSASTFILTIWHGTRDAELLRRDSRIIEFTLKMYNEESQYASVLLQRAHRILRNVALRALSFVTDDGQRKRMQDLLRQSGGGIGGASSMSKASSVAATTLTRDPISSATGSSSAFVPPSSPHHLPSSGTTTPRSGASRHPFAALRHDRLSNVSDVGSVPLSASASASTDANIPSASPRHFHLAGSPPGSGSAAAVTAHGEASLDALDVQNWLPMSSVAAAAEANTNASMRSEIDAISSGFQFDGDLSWTDYFARYLGGLQSDLPQPSRSRMGSGTPTAAFTPDALTEPV